MFAACKDGPVQSGAPRRRRFAQERPSLATRPPSRGSETAIVAAMAAAAAASGDGSKAAPAGGSPIEGISTVVVHPLVMLSVTDHYKRVAMNTKKRVVGMLLGHSHKGRVDVVNSFAVPFAEDPTDPKVWFLDHFYLDKMYKMFRKVASECPGGGLRRCGGAGP